MIRQGQEQQRLNAGAENGEGGATSSPGPVRKYKVTSEIERKR